MVYRECMEDTQKMQEDEQVMHQGCPGDAWRMREAHKGDSKERRCTVCIRGAQAFPVDAEEPRMGTQGMKENGQ